MLPSLRLGALAGRQLEAGLASGKQQRHSAVQVAYLWSPCERTAHRHEVHCIVPVLGLGRDFSLTGLPRTSGDLGCFKFVTGTVQVLYLQ